MKYSRKSLIHIVGEKELDQLIAECKLKRAVEPGNRFIMKSMQDEYGFDHRVAYSIYRLAFPTYSPPENYTLRERK